MEIDKCIEIEFKSAHEIHQHLRKLKFKEGKWTIQIFETKKPGNIICPYYGNETKRPSKYIGASDDNRKINARWRMIEQEMKAMKIEKVSVKVCPFIELKKQKYMNINCINNKIINAKGVLQPIVLQVIKDIYLNGNNQMTASMVKDHCMNIAPNTTWNGRVPAICNAMRNSIQCGGRIIGEDRDFLDFTIAFDGNENSIGIDTPIKNPKNTSPKVESKKKHKPNISNKPSKMNLKIELEKLNLSKQLI